MNFADVEKIYDLNFFLEKLEFDSLEFIREPLKLYHYTSSNALKSIIENRELWLSKADFLNDRTEIKYTLNLANEIINELLPDTPSDDDLVFKETFNQFFIRNSFLFDVYILSLSANQDSNLLWSNYSNNDGYNIEFQYPLVSLNLQHSINFKLGIGSGTLQQYFVIYSSDEQKQLLKKEIINLYTIFKYCLEINNYELYSSSVRIPITNILMYSVFFKDECFSQEKEFRIALVVQREKVKHDYYNCRINNGVFIPYISIPLEEPGGENPISLITIGPKNNLDIAEEGLRSFLNLNNLSGCEIKKSRIPYRF